MSEQSPTQGQDTKAAQAAGREPTEKHPPKPRFALAVGVIGHRPNRLPAADSEKAKLDKVAKDIGDVLDAIIAAASQASSDHRSLFEDKPPALSVVSSLAEGADRIAALIAVQKKFCLDVPLPFDQEEYEKDFGPRTSKPGETIDEQAEKERSRKSIEQFRWLISPPQARAILQLPGTRKRADDFDDPDAKRAYEAAGLTVLSQADIVLAVWDGKPSEGRGGTPDILAEAVRAGLPVIIVDAEGVRPPELRWRNLMTVPAPIVAIEDLPSIGVEKGLLRVIDELVRLPAASDQREAFHHWYKERPCKFNLRFGYPLLMAVLWVKGIRWADVHPSSPGELSDEYKVPAAVLAAAKADISKVSLLAHPYGWADAVALWCSQIFRGAFVLNFVFASAAVVAAAVALLGPSEPTERTSFFDWFRWPNWLIALEIFLIVCVITNTWIGLRWRWHRRWVEARELAERFRVALPLWALGLRPGFFPGEEATWMGWYVRAFVRMQGLRSGDLNREFAATRSVLMDVLSGQCEYNARNAYRMHALERRLEWVGFILFVLTLLVAVDHFFFGPAMHCLLARLHLGHDLEHRIAIGLSAALPALATATYGIRVIGDFEGIHRRAERTQQGLDQLIRAIKQDPTDFALLRARARSAGDAMLGDVSSWRLSAESRGLAIPG